jgi:hypothetical protein
MRQRVFETCRLDSAMAQFGDVFIYENSRGGASKFVGTFRDFLGYVVCR